MSSLDEPVLCACGCGEPTRVYPGGKVKKFRRGHNSRLKDGSAPNRSHGLSNTPTWHSWSNMINRCTQPNNPAYDRYGGRGISVCPQWTGTTGFAAFLNDMGEKPDGHSLERINNEHGYDPENCRWATPKEQAANTRHVTLLEVDIEWVRAHPEKSRAQLARALDVTESTISNIRNRKGRFADPS